MRVNEIRRKTEKELKKMLQENQGRLMELRFKLETSKVKNVKEISRIKKDIARILTILKSKDKK